MNSTTSPTRKTSSVAEKQRLAAAEAEKKNDALAEANDSRSAPLTEIKNRLASVHFTQDMLAGTEGF